MSVLQAGEHYGFIQLMLCDSVLHGNAATENVTAAFASTWRRSIRRIGGFWLGTMEANLADVGRDWAEELFYYGLLREIRERAGGSETWRGAIVKMEYQRGPDTFIKDITLMSNAVKSIYTKIGDNLITNPSGEVTAWAAYNGGTTSQSTAWVTDGAYSTKIIAASSLQGASIQDIVAVTAGVQYLVRVAIHADSGSWRVSVNRADNGQSLCHFSTRSKVGDFAVAMTIDATNTYTGNANFVITAESAGTIYGDAAVFQEAPDKAETSWQMDSNSILEFGRKENILLRGGKSDADANAEVLTELYRWSWPNPTPPPRSRTVASMNRGEDKISLTVAGYWAMLNWLFTTLNGTQTASAWVSAIMALQPTYVTPGLIETNSMDYFVENRAPLRLGDLLADVALVGDSSGNRWGIGVYEDRRLNYEQIPAELTYFRQNGKLLTIAQSEIEPWLARPGWALWQDLPIGVGQISGLAQHDPRWVFLEQIEMMPDGTLEFELEQKA